MVDLEKYHIDIFWSEENEGYIVDVPDLDYCSAFDATHEEALIAMDLHLDILLKTGRPFLKLRAYGEIGGRTVTPQQVDGPDRAVTQNPSEADLWDAVRKPFRELSNRTVTLQESNLRLTQNCFKQFVEQLKSRTKVNRQTTETLQRQGQHQLEAFQTLVEESAAAYSDFLNSALSFYKQTTLQQATQVAQSNLHTGGQVAQQGAQAAPVKPRSIVQAASNPLRLRVDACSRAPSRAPSALPGKHRPSRPPRVRVLLARTHTSGGPSGIEVEIGLLQEAIRGHCWRSIRMAWAS